MRFFGLGRDISLSSERVIASLASRSLGAQRVGANIFTANKTRKTVSVFSCRSWLSRRPRSLARRGTCDRK